jgi:hypothetical protein
MHDVDKFRREKAQDCHRRSIAAFDPVDKRFWSDLAEQWSKLVKEKEARRRRFFGFRVP